MSDTVYVSNLCIHGFHGVRPEETRLGQRFYIDIECTLDTAACTADDDYDKTVCYATLCDLAAEVSRNGPYKLIETFGERITQAVLARFPSVTRVRVRVRKPSAPISATFDHVGVEITRERRYRIGLSLGSNLGDKVANIRTALMLLSAEEGMDVDSTSRFYRTEPWGNEAQDWFVNVCSIGSTTLRPMSILKTCKRIEVALGRVPAERWGPRAIDIDLLFIDDLDMVSPALTLPHPEMFNRAFVLVPLAEIASHLDIGGRNVGVEAERIHTKSGGVRPLDVQPT